MVVYGAFGGRMDQEMQSVNALFHWGQTFGSLVLAGQECFAVLLPGPAEDSEQEAARYRIRRCSWQGDTCGLIPIAGKVQHLTTAGLKWDMQDATCGFGGLVSTSNAMEKEEVFVDTSGPLLWTAAWTVPDVM